MTAARALHYVPYDEFLQSERESDLRHEWVNGEVYAMSRGTPEHARLTNRVAARLLDRLVGDGCESYGESAAIFIEAAQHHTYADGMLVCGPLVTRVVRDRNGKSLGEAITNPTVLVEVLSESTERYDRDGKFTAYKQIPSLCEYVLVSQEERKIEIRRHDQEGWHTSIAYAGETFVVHEQEFTVDSIYV